MLSIINLIIIVMFVVIIAVLSIKKKELLIYVFIIYFMLTTYEWIASKTLRWNILVMNINILDIFCLYLLTVTILNFYKNYKQKHKYEIERGQYATKSKNAIIFLILTFVIAVIRGVISYGYNESVQEDVRRFIEAWIIPLCCIMYYPIDLYSKKTHKGIKALSTITIIFCFICWFLDIVLGIKIMNAQSDAGSTMRVLRPEQAVLISMIAIYFLDEDINRKKCSKISLRTCLLILTVVLLQHRTAWATLSVGIITFIIMRNVKNGFSLKIKRNLLIQVCTISAICVGMLFIMQGTPLMKSISVGLDGFKGEEGGTFDYRRQLWEASLKNLNRKDWILGKPFGSGYLINLENYSRILTPHNAYVQSILRVGIIGLFFILYPILTTIVSALKNKCFFVICISLMILTMWVSYSYNMNIAFFYGLTMHLIHLKSINKINEKNGECL